MWAHGACRKEKINPRASISRDMEGLSLGLSAKDTTSRSPIAATYPVGVIRALTIWSSIMTTSKSVGICAADTNAAPHIIKCETFFTTV